MIESDSSSNLHPVVHDDASRLDSLNNIHEEGGESPFTLEPRVFSTTVRGRRHRATYLCAITPEGGVLAQRELGNNHSVDVYDLVAQAANDRLVQLQREKEEADARAKEEGQLFNDLSYIDTKAVEVSRREIAGVSNGSTAVEKTVQLTLAGMTLKREKVSFGRFVKPELFDVFGEHDFNKLTESEKKWDPHAALSRAVFEPARSRKGKGEGELALVVDGYGLNAYEYRLIIRNPESLVNATASRIINDNEVVGDRLSAKDRGIIHTFTSMKSAMIEHLSKLATARAEVQELAKEAKSPGYAHYDMEWMKQRLSTVWKEFQTMLDVMHVQRNWNDEKRQAASTALLYYLTQGSQADRVRNWRNMIQLADGYLGARVHIFGDRIQRANAVISSVESGQIRSEVA